MQTQISTPSHSKCLVNFLLSVDMSEIDSIDGYNLRLSLPLLTRFALCKSVVPQAQSLAPVSTRRSLLLKLMEFVETNFITQSLSADFNEVHYDSVRQSALRKKQREHSQEADDDIDIEFEGLSSTQRVKAVVCDLLELADVVAALSQPNSSTAIAQIPGLLRNEVYQDKVSDIACLAALELPNLIDVSTLVNSALYLYWPVDLVTKLVINVPWSVTKVAQKLVDLCSEKEPPKIVKRRVEVIQQLCVLYPPCVTPVIDSVIRENKLQELIAWIHLIQPTSNKLHSISELITSYKLIAKNILCNKNQTEDNKYMAVIRSSLEHELDKLIGRELTSSDHMTVTMVIRTYATLREIVAYKFSNEELTKIFKLFPRLPSTNSSESRLVILALCLVFASVHQLNEYSSNLSGWIRALSHNTQLYTGASEGSIGQFLLLVAIHYHGNQLTAISEMVSSHLHIKPSTVKLANTVLKSIITMEVFTEQVISQLVVLLSVTKRLSSNTPGHLPIHCVCQLLKSRAFSKNNVSISQWIFDQISELTLPLHHTVVPMIQGFVTSTMPQQHNVRQANAAIPEPDLAKIFDENDESLDTDMEREQADFPVKVVLLFYILSYQHAIQTESVQHVKKRVLQSYSEGFMSRLPVKRLVLMAYKKRDHFNTLYPALLRLLHTLYPHLCLPNMWMPSPRVYTNTSQLISQLSKLVIKDENRSQYLYVKLSQSDLPLNADSIQLVTETINYIQATPVQDVPRRVSMVLLEVWTRFARVAPEKIYVRTVTTLRDQHNPVTNDQLVSDPLLILQSLPSCRHPALISIVLELIEVYTHASRSYFNHVAVSRLHPGIGQALTDAKETCYSLLSAQESAILQILLEQCLPQSQDEANELCERREIQNLICSYAHKVIINNPTVAKLVCFQGFDTRLIPIMVAGIPSLHICLDNIPELLAQSDITKQMFAVRLTSELCSQYKVHRSFTMAKLCVGTLTTLTTVLPLKRIVDCIVPMIPPVLNMCQHFPILYEDWSQLLVRLIPLSSLYNEIREDPKLRLLATS